MEEGGQNMSSFIRGWCISTVFGILRQFIVVFSPQWISVCKIHACKVAYHAPVHPWVYFYRKLTFLLFFSYPSHMCGPYYNIQSSKIGFMSCSL